MTKRFDKIICQILKFIHHGCVLPNFLLKSKFASVTMTILIWGITNRVSAQNDTISLIQSFLFNVETDILSLKKDSKQNSQISIISGKPEDINEALYNVYILKRNDIENSGVSSLSEALRLIPGCIVHEQTKGNYDIVLSGSPYIYSGENEFAAIGSRSVVVLVNSIPSVNTFDNKVWWENLPGIQNIEQIEVLTSPLTSIHGLSSTGGAVNIITRKNALDKLHVVGESSIDITGSHNVSMFAESSVNEKLKVNLSFSYNFSKRPDIRYYVKSRRKEIEHSLLMSYQDDVEETHLYPEMAQRSFFLQSQANVQLAKNVEFDVIFQHQSSEVQTSHLNHRELFLMERRKQENAILITGNTNGLEFYTRLALGLGDFANGVDGYDFNFRTLQTRINYPFKHKSFSLNPNIIFNRFSYENQSSKDWKNKSGLPSFNENMGQFYPNLSGTYASENFRLKAIFGYNYCNAIKKGLSTWSLAFGHSGSRKYNFRAAITRSYDPVAIWQNSTWNLSDSSSMWNTSSRPVAVLNIETGFKTRALWFLKTDFSVFRRSFSRFPVVDKNNEKIQHNQSKTAVEILGVLCNLKFDIGKLQVNPFFRFQRVSLNSSENSFVCKFPNNQLGLSVHYSIFYNQLQLNLLVSHMSKYSFFYERRTYEFNRRTNTYFKATYSFWKDNYLFFSLKNPFSAHEREFLFADHILPSYLFGLRFNIYSAQ